MWCGDRVQAAAVQACAARHRGVPAHSVHICQTCRLSICPKHVPTMSTPLRKFMCVVCGYIYDEAEGIPEEGIAPGTRFEDIPDTWTCPDCGATKADFELITTE